MNWKGWVPWCFLAFFLAAPLAQSKPFKRVLVLSGGGMNPGFSVGAIAGLQEMGWRPDLVIATCGGSLGSVIVSSQIGIVESFQLLTSWEHFNLAKQFEIETANGITLIQKLQKAKDRSVYPDIFSGNLLWGPETIDDFLKNNDFNQNPNGPRMIILSARALFGPERVGEKRDAAPLFKQIYFTDPETATHLQGRHLERTQAYPFTTLSPDTQVLTNTSVLNAMRAGIGDPYLLNPGLVDGFYHFTGAVDLFPIDLAVELGDEVVATYPSMLFEEYEDDAIESAFGFRQTKRALEAIQHRDVKWIDQRGAELVTFNPQRKLFVMVSGVPDTLPEFQRRVVRQWDLGRERGKEALAVAPGKMLDVRSHLRKPISPKLLEEFSCRNAYEWKTEYRDSCVSDEGPECDRSLVKSCLPIR